MAVSNDISTEISEKQYLTSRMPYALTSGALDGLARRLGDSIPSLGLDPFLPNYGKRFLPRMAG